MPWRAEPIAEPIRSDLPRSARPGFSAGSVRAVSVLREHFLLRTGELAELATVHTVEDDYSVRLTVVPNQPESVGVVLHLLKARHSQESEIGTVSFDDQASVSAELGHDLDEDLRAIDEFIADARHGRVTAFHVGRGVPRLWTLRDEFSGPG